MNFADYFPLIGGVECYALFILGWIGLFHQPYQMVIFQIKQFDQHNLPDMFFISI